MASKRPKTTDGLMRYLRDQKGIAISGSAQKRKLMNMGYYHGYKGYRYIREGSNQVPYRNFNELAAVYEFDAQLKALFYPCVMQIETAMKNYVLEVILESIHSESFIDVYGRLLDNYRMFTAGKYKKELKRRLELRNRIYRTQTEAFAKNKKIAEHYLNKDVNLPIWAIFELLSLGEFGHFVSCLNTDCRRDVSKKLGIRQSDDSEAALPEKLIYAVKDLRNAIAHNDVIFDTRFRTGHIDSQVGSAISNATGVRDIRFNTITDYLVLIVYLMKLMHVPKTELKKLITSFVECTDRLHKAVPFEIYSKIIYTNHRAKIADLRRGL